ncbi:transglutaminaseTgpA domain-containing protein [Phytoactinopolyspora limicola]|uniref:transglutaminase family protein n=1 Tax=Phytoactinopolyspora limicola TaxID=2715536 RepID=UPI00140B1AF5|nr:DUF3488 and transglutaminase-like domain-containing protein [Phytoactinopolyspora limicola]
MIPQTRPTVVAGIAALISIIPLLELTDNASWLAPAAIAVVVVCAVGLMGRQFRVPGALILLAQLMVVTWWLGLLIAADLAWFGVFPSTTWPDRFRAVASEANEAIETLGTPVPVSDGILLYMVAGIAAIAIAVDLLVGTWRRSALAGVPLAAAYAVTAGIQGGDLGWWWFVPPAVGYMALLIVESRRRVSAWGSSAGPPTDASGEPAAVALARNGRRVGGVALAAAVAIPAFVPILTDGVVSGRGGGGGSGDGRTIRTDNPILDLQRNLTRPDNVDILRYSASDSSSHYIRTVTLDSFDGDVWKMSDRPVPESQRVSEGMPEPPGLDLEEPPDEVEIQFAVDTIYASKWLPLAYPAQHIDIDGDWRYDPATLDVVAADSDAAGMVYSAVSLDVTFDAAILQDAGEPRTDVDDLLDLPDELPDIVTDLADEVTSDASDDFSRAAALQQWFRGPSFTYDLTTQPGTSSSALADFLEDRSGYCEQFAATMAIMARYLDIPARVAVGFTPGTFEGDGTWLVRAHDAHAWPELYFEGMGWVRFEPTPAARTGTAPAWTLEPNETAPDEEPDSPDNTSTAPPTNDLDQFPDEDILGGGGSTTTTSQSPWPLVVAGTVAALAVLACVPAALARVRRAWRWRRAGADPVAQAAASWAEIGEAARDAGLPWDAATTPRAAGRTITAQASLADEPRILLDHLVRVTERARYARRAEPVSDLRADTSVLSHTLVRSGSRIQRARAFLWPATLTDGWNQLTGRVTAVLDWMETSRPRLRAALARTGRR